MLIDFDHGVGVARQELRERFLEFRCVRIAYVHDAHAQGTRVHRTRFLMGDFVVEARQIEFALLFFNREDLQNAARPSVFEAVGGENTLEYVTPEFV